MDTIYAYVSFEKELDCYNKSGVFEAQQCLAFNWNDSENMKSTLLWLFTIRPQAELKSKY